MILGVFFISPSPVWLIFLTNGISDTLRCADIRRQERIFRVKNAKTIVFFATKTNTGSYGIIFHRKEAGLRFSIRIRPVRIYL